MRRNKAFHERACAWLAIVACQAVVVTALLWPALRSSPHALPTTLMQSSATVPLLNAWTMWWNADRLGHGLEGYWDAPIFFPERGALAFSEPQPATLTVAPLVWLTRSPVAAYHAYLWLSLLLNGLAAALCLRKLRVGWFLTGSGSLAVTLLPIAWDNLDAIQLVPLWGMLWSVHALLGFSQRPTLGRAVMLSVACSSVFFLSVHHGVFFLVSLFPACMCLVHGRGGLRCLANCAAAGIMSAALLAPLLVPMSRVHAQHRFQRSRQTQESLSATTSQWLQVPERGLSRIPLQGLKDADAIRALNPGWGRCALALVAVASTLAARKHRRRVLCLATLAAASLVLSFGTNLSLGSQEIWPVIGRLVPPLDSARSIFRFAYVTQLAVILLAALGADRLMRMLRYRSLARPRHPLTPRHGRVRQIVLLGCCLCAGLLLALEVPAPKLNLIGVPDTRVAHDWIVFLQNNGGGKPILCLPFAESFSEAGLEPSARWMLYATEHKLPLLNGYSGFFPRSWYENVERWRSPQMSEELARFLHERTVAYIVVDRSKPTCLSAVQSPLALGEFELKRVVKSDRKIDVWQLMKK